MSKRQSARDAARERGKGDFWIDHAELVDADNDWLSDAEKLTLWNVRTLANFLAGLPKLWWLDLRGGTGLVSAGISNGVYPGVMAMVPGITRC